MGSIVRESTAVVVVGAGAAGMTAAALLRRCGINCVVLERQAREYVEQRQRAGIVEYRAARMFGEWGLGGLLGDFPSDSTLEIRVDGRSHLLGRDELSRRCPARLTPQQVLVRNLISSFVDDGGDLRFQAAEVTLTELVHDLANEDRRFAAQLAAARLGRVLSSEAATRDLAELMAGLA